MSSGENRPSLDDPNAWVPYRYIPSQSAAITFVVLFSLTTIFHAFQLIRKRTWYFIPMVLGGLFEAIGYIGRILSKNDIWVLGPFIMQSLLLLVAPALFAASIYIILGRIILLTDGERYSIIRQKWLTKLFVAGDILSFCTQGSGGGIQAGGTLESMETGEKIILVGLFIQIAVFGFFVVVAGIFHYRVANDRPSKSVFPPMSKKTRAQQGASPLSPMVPVDVSALPWKKHIYLLYAASVLIMIRSIFRVVEYAQGNNGYLLRHEVFLYVFDAALMFMAMVLFNFVHPSEVTDIHSKRKSEACIAEFEIMSRYLSDGGQEETHMGSQRI